MMKKWLFFLCGLIVGIGLTLTIVYIVNSENDTVSIEDDIIPEVEDSPELDNTPTNLDVEIPGEIINEKSFKVFQVWTQINALVYGKDKYGDYSGTVYLLKNEQIDLALKKVSPFYDDQIVNVPKGKVVRLFGTYQYPTRDGHVKTVPVIKIVDN